MANYFYSIQLRFGVRPGLCMAQENISDEFSITGSYAMTNYRREWIFHGVRIG